MRQFLTRLWRPVTLTLLATTFLLLIPFAIARSQGASENLFIGLGHERVGQGAATLRSQAVAVNWQALREGRRRSLTLNLFDDLSIKAIRDRLDPSTVDNGYVWVGHVAEDLNSEVTLSVAGNVLTGLIRFGDGDIVEVSSSSGGQQLRQIDPHTQWVLEGPDQLDPPPMLSSNAAGAQSCEDGSQIDLLVAYTPQARDWIGGEEAMRALINQRVSQMNTANINSGLDFRYRLVHEMETNYQESGSVSEDLPRLQNSNDGIMDDVTTARDEKKADLVGLYISEAKRGGACGVAYVMNELSTSFEGWAFNVSALDYAGDYYCSDLTLAHEFGHTSGNRHDRNHNSGVPLLPYSFGHQAPSGSFRTIMSYNCPDGCPRINHWSNPEVNYDGQPTGIDHFANPAFSADNAGSMALSAIYVANFRPNCGNEATPTPTDTVTAIPEDTATVTPGSEPSATPTTTAESTLTPTPSSTPEEPTPTVTLSPTAMATWTTTTTATPTLVATSIVTATASPMATEPTPATPTELPPLSRPFSAFVPFASSTSS